MPLRRRQDIFLCGADNRGGHAFGEMPGECDGCHRCAVLFRGTENSFGYGLVGFFRRIVFFARHLVGFASDGVGVPCRPRR